MHRLKTKRTKKKKQLPISVFPTSVECHRRVFIFLTLFRKHTWYVAGCVGGFLRACTNIDEYGPNQFLGFYFSVPFLGSRSLFLVMRVAMWCPCVNHATPPPPPVFTIHLCVDAAVKSTNMLINHTSKSNVKPLLRRKKSVFFFLF